MTIESLETRALLTVSAAAVVPPPDDAAPAHPMHAYAHEWGAPSHDGERAGRHDFSGDRPRGVQYGSGDFHDTAEAPVQYVPTPFIYFDRRTGEVAVVYVMSVPNSAPDQPPAVNQTRAENQPASVDQPASPQVQSVAAVPPVADIPAANTSLPREAKVAANAALDVTPARANAPTAATPTVASANAPVRTSGGTFSSRLIASMEFASTAASNAVAGAAAVVRETESAAAAVVTPVVAAAVEAAPRLFHFAQINWAAAFADPWGDLTEEGASLPLATARSNARAWAITGAVATFDLVLASRYFVKRSRRKNPTKAQAIEFGLA